jgi:chemotaxis protein MotA
VFVIIGIVLVLGFVLGGYMMEHGNMSILFQPAEMVIIFGSAFGGFVISSPMKVLKAVLGSIPLLFKGKSYSKDDYQQALMLLSEIFFKIRKEGVVAIEADVDNPENSEIFKKYPKIIANHHALAFITDTLRTISITDIESHELAGLLENEIEAHHEEALIPSKAIAAVADSMPGLGIVAAVLGICITMQSINAPPEVLGHHIGAALIGTFLGILMSYGFIAPMSKNLEYAAGEDTEYLTVLKAALVAFVNTTSPQLAVEFGRRIIPGELKPSFVELEEAIKSLRK